MLWWLGLFVALIVVVSIIMYFDDDAREQRKKRKLAQIAEREQEIEFKNKYKCKKSYTLEHLYGLNIPQGAECGVWICSKRLVMYYGAPITLFYSKIIKAEILDQTQFKKHYLDNATGAIAGGMLLGAAGALLGGGTKTITESDKKYILAITYKSDDEIKYILFDVTANKVTAKNVIADINYRRTKIVENKRPKEKNL
jgi:hypothetical protein|nr:MAG TPA: hypothetical protein [Caudoviricetes sp.]